MKNRARSLAFALCGLIGAVSNPDSPAGNGDASTPTSGVGTTRFSSAAAQRAASRYAARQLRMTGRHTRLAAGSASSESEDSGAEMQRFS